LKSGWTIKQEIRDIYRERIQRWTIRWNSECDYCKAKNISPDSPRIAPIIKLYDIREAVDKNNEYEEDVLSGIQNSSY
jgi:hypothetical protein